MSLQPCREPECDRRDAEPGPVEVLVESRPRDLGAFTVRRLLPASARRRVGPFVFFDHMGPTRLAPGAGLDVRPHPHIGLATVTYLFEGTILHRDSLGSVQPIRPGAVNWMTAGRGIVHSERTPAELRTDGSSLHGLQIWLGLPREAEDMEPAFVHHPAETIPRVQLSGASLRVVVGAAYQARSPVETASETLYVAGELQTGATIALPDGVAECAVYVASGEAAIAETTIPAGSMAILRPGAAARLEARSDARIAILGGTPLDGERHLWWNFVSSTPERIERAKADWKAGRFPEVPEETERIPLPED